MASQEEAHILLDRVVTTTRFLIVTTMLCSVSLTQHRAQVEETLLASILLLSKTKHQ
jgi:hypothetical protein